MFRISLSPFTRAFSVILLVLITLLYSSYERKVLYNQNNLSDNLILKKLPNFQVETIYDQKKLESVSTYGPDTKAMFVHLWGTWCAPCEAELPFLIEYAKKPQNKDVKFLLIAVNDSLLKVKKFFDKIKNLPSNIILAYDNTNQSMDLLGTIKVPETYLFNRQKKHIKKFVGPQNWELVRTEDFINFSLTN